ncbi:type 2 isopentenyl-diphosphate Delta-isomerase [Bacillus taeanensis]|uniref:Isopentenyl-diphosphate delta-isomerase n=1 Tax=Bacillus taeanensis TaxID=273032 RepID=A0A366XW75_9BACI|nr:type 2 isopentenyl-diphosphate Delta-isomerase [Bacillus taeanensis]RBW70402.1 type 2 isopentenyl-diphosphate Delta-isomerase [Bacillus taeanensis]
MMREKRKHEHIEYALSTGQLDSHGFEDVKFIHQSVPNTSTQNIDLSTAIGELFLSSPIFINAMTGGGGERTKEINRHWAEIAKHCGLAMAVGSQMAALKDEKQKSTYEVVRKYNPNGLVFANLGSEATVEQAKQAVDMIEANALQIHLNVIQELVMPEGDRNFIGTLQRIENIVEQVSVPIIVKEVGFGMSKEAIEQLVNIGVSIVDIGGFGGTNFSTIENKRRSRMLSYFNDWGIQTTSSIAEAAQTFPFVSVIGSGGVQNGYNAAKAIGLGASAVGISGYFLKVLNEEGPESVIEHVMNIHNDLKMIMTALGKESIALLKKAPLMINGNTYHWLEQRGIKTQVYSNR